MHHGLWHGQPEAVIIFVKVTVIVFIRLMVMMCVRLNSEHVYVDYVLCDSATVSSPPRLSLLRLIVIVEKESKRHSETHPFNAV